MDQTPPSTLSVDQKAGILTKKFHAAWCASHPAATEQQKRDVYDQQFALVKGRIEAHERQRPVVEARRANPATKSIVLYPFPPAVARIAIEPK